MIEPHPVEPVAAAVLSELAAQIALTPTPTLAQKVALLGAHQLVSLNTQATTGLETGGAIFANTRRAIRLLEYIENPARCKRAGEDSTRAVQALISSLQESIRNGTFQAILDCLKPESVQGE